MIYEYIFDIPDYEMNAKDIIHEFSGSMETCIYDGKVHVFSNRKSFIYGAYLVINWEE